MSLILDALRRAERTREQDLRQRVAHALPPRARRAAPAGAWLAVAASLAVALWLGWPQAPPDPARATAGVEDPRPTAAEGVAARGSSLADIPLPVADPAPRAAPAAPLLLELPDVRAAVGDLRLDAHVWSPQPARRFVVLGMQRYRAGDAVRPGLRLHAVTEDGAEFDWRGTRFRVTAR